MVDTHSIHVYNKQVSIRHVVVEKLEINPSSEKVTNLSRLFLHNMLT